MNEISSSNSHSLLVERYKTNKDVYEDYEDFDESLYEEEDYTNLEISNININEYDQLDEKDITDICLHKHITNNNEVEICSDCGIEMYKELSLEPEWRFYGNNDSKHSSDPSRCYIRKVDEKNIFKDIQKYDFPVNIGREINTSYLEVTKGQIRRGNFRKSIIFACSFNSYKNQGNPQNPEELREKFGLTKKEASRGLTFYNLNKKDKRKKPIYISPVSFIPRVMQKFNANKFHISKVTELYMRIHNRSKLLNRSNPQSVISGLVYYYFKLIGGNITCPKFSKIVKLSDITISRISKNISEILMTTDVLKLS
jgi:transcription initiation factor TFIIIB Brf1 subunit/transcription initiation factor TFIIB